jgi:hypothetical protein
MFRIIKSNETLWTMWDVKPIDISGIKRGEYLKGKINELATNSKTTINRDLYTGINELRGGGYQPRNNLVKDENGYVLADSHNILNGWKNYFSQ